MFYFSQTFLLPFDLYLEKEDCVCNGCSVIPDTNVFNAANISQNVKFVLTFFYGSQRSIMIWLLKLMFLET